jgi:hypothetical protein
VSDDSGRLREQLERRAPGQWELFEKTAGSQELESTGAERVTVARREAGWAARWWEGEAPRFACGSSPENLESAMADAQRVETSPEPPPQWPETRSAAREPSAGARVEPPPDLFEELQRRVSAESRGEALLHRLTVRRGASAERIFNGRGLDVSTAAALLDGRALAIGRKGSRSCEARAVFRWEREPDLEGLARRLADSATLALSEHGTPVDRGEWLLEPSVAAAFRRARPALPRGTAALGAQGGPSRGTSPSGRRFRGRPRRRRHATRRVAVVLTERLGARLHDLRLARRAGLRPRPRRVLHRLPARPGPRRPDREPAPARA